MRTFVALAFAGIVVACTETPSDLPPCIGITSCPAAEAGADGGAPDAAAMDGPPNADDASNTQ